MGNRCTKNFVRVFNPPAPQLHQTRGASGSQLYCAKRSQGGGRRTFAQHSNAATRLHSEATILARLIYQPEQKQPDQNTSQSIKANLPIMQFQYLFKHAPPASGRQKRQQTFNNQYQCECSPNIVHTIGLWVGQIMGRQGAFYLRAAGAGATEPPPRIALKKSEDGSSTITSLFLENVALYASRLR